MIFFHFSAHGQRQQQHRREIQRQRSCADKQDDPADKQRRAPALFAQHEQRDAARKRQQKENQRQIRTPKVTLLSQADTRNQAQGSSDAMTESIRREILAQDKV